MGIPTLTENELEIMELLWKEGCPLSKTEIIELTPDRSWSERSIHILLNNLLEKEAIRVEGFVRTNKNFGRTFLAQFSHEDYIAAELNHLTKSKVYHSKKSAVTSVFAALVQDEDINDEVLGELEQMLSERRKQIKG